MEQYSDEIILNTAKELISGKQTVIAADYDHIIKVLDAFRKLKKSVVIHFHTDTPDKKFYITLDKAPGLRHKLDKIKEIVN